MAAFTAAMTNPGCDGVELDVRLSRDGVPVVIHDETLARVQGVPGRVEELTAIELRRAGVPPLRDALEVLREPAFLDIELKGDKHGPATADVLRAARGDAPRRAVVSSFDPASLLAMRDHLGGWPRWLNAEDLAPQTLSLAMGLGCEGIAAAWGSITRRGVEEARTAGLVVVAWTVRRSSTFDRMAGLGVFACCVEAHALDG